ncbi:MAG: DUF1461 domain-containing protein [Eggerthellaceae bacterium]|nr:DUF1461 domain-containing protein [Eggerthellaceae bacterium]
MNRFQIILGQISLAVCALAIGLCVCVVPQAPTALFAGWYGDVDNSPMTREEIVSFSAVVHDYTFFDQDRTKLYAGIVAVNDHIIEDGRGSDGQPVLTSGDEASVAAAFDAADEAYVLHTDMIDHLDDVSHVVFIMLCVAAAFLVLASIELMNAYFRGHRADMCTMLVGGGVVALVVIALGLVGGFVAFDSLFTLMHQLLFEDGTWTFSPNSALICTLPTDFWVAMGALLLAVSAIVSVIFIAIGKLMKSYKL